MLPFYRHRLTRPRVFFLHLAEGMSYLGDEENDRGGGKQCWAQLSHGEEDKCVASFGSAIPLFRLISLDQGVGHDGGIGIVELGGGDK